MILALLLEEDANAAVFNPAGTIVYVQDTSGIVDAFGFNSTTGQLSAAPLFTINGVSSHCYYGMDTLTISPDGARLYVSEYSNAQIGVFDATNGNSLGTITDPGVINEPTGITLAHAGAGATATFTTSSLSGGTHAITAGYSGDTNFAISSNSVLQTVTTACTSTSVSSSSNSSVFGQSVTFTATVTAGSLTFDNGGTVTFSDGSTSLGTASLSGGQATYSAPSSVIDTVTTHTIRASYSGDTNFSGSSNSVLQTVSTACTSTSVSSSSNSSVYGQSVTFTATVSVASAGAGQFDNGGTVTFSDGSTSLGTASLNGGQATYSAPSSVIDTVTTHTITASYSGDTNFTTSSNSVLQTVNKASASTTVTSSVNPSLFGQSVTFTATVSAVSPGAGTPTGTVTFLDAGSPLQWPGTVALGNGTAIFMINVALTVDSHNITVVYGGDGNFTGSTSPVLIQVVKQATMTTAYSLVNPTVFGQCVAVTATVNGYVGIVPTGTVTFLEGSTPLAASTPNGSGTATYTTSSLSVGQHVVTAVYGGDANSFGSTSIPVVETVNQASTSTTLTSSLNPSSYGQSVIFSVTVSAQVRRRHAGRDGDVRRRC